MSRDQRRGQPNNPGQFAPDTRGKTHTPTEQRTAATPQPQPTHTAAAYGEQFDRMKAAENPPTRVENDVHWTQSHIQHRRDGWTIIDERATGTYTGSKGEGYSGVRPGMNVDINRTQWIRPDGSVARESYACSVDKGAWLAVYEPDRDLRLDTQPDNADEDRFHRPGFCARCGDDLRGLQHPHNCPGADTSHAREIERCASLPEYHDESGTCLHG